jgi:hypothetical protein
MTKTDNAKLVGVHKFEAAGLGKAPFRFAGTSENVVVVGTGEDAYTKAGGSCDYCGSCIRTEFWLLSADGRRFKVGCDCIEKAGERGVLQAYKSSPEYRAKQREKARAKDNAVLAELLPLMEILKPTLVAAPHPYGFTDRQTGVPLTAWDSLQWSFNACGASGRAKLLKGLKIKYAEILK